MLDGIRRLAKLNAPSALTVGEALTQLRKSRAAHLWWVNHFRKMDPVEALAVEFDFHLALIEKYDNLLESFDGLPDKMPCPQWAGALIADDRAMTKVIQDSLDEAP